MKLTDDWTYFKTWTIGYNQQHLFKSHRFICNFCKTFVDAFQYNDSEFMIMCGCSNNLFIDKSILFAI